MFVVPPPHAIAADLDGTVVDTEGPAHAAWLAGADRTSLSELLTPAFFHGLTGRSSVDIRSALIEQVGDEVLVDRLRTVAWDVYKELLSEGIRLMPGVEELLELARAVNLPITIATSSSRESALDKLAKAKLANQFEIIVTSEDVSKGKPAPDIFLKAAETLRVAPADCWALEDSHPGATAALAAQMPTWMITPQESQLFATYPTKPIIVRSLTEVTATLRALQSR